MRSSREVPTPSRADSAQEENPRRVGLLMEIPDMDAVMAALQTENGAAAMQSGGVLAETLVILVEA